MLHEDLHRFRKVSSSIGNRVQGYFQLSAGAAMGATTLMNPPGVGRPKLSHPPKITPLKPRSITSICVTHYTSSGVDLLGL